MKREKKERKAPLRIKDRPERGAGRRFRLRLPAKARHSADSSAGAAGFAVTMHPSEPVMRLKEDRTKAQWQQELPANLPCALLVMSAVALFCMCIGEPALIPFALTCPLVFMAVSVARTLKIREARWITPLVLGLILIACAAIWSDAVSGGLRMLINRFYDAAEEAQAYIYDRPSEGYVSDGAARAAIAWISALAGLITAIPPVRFRRAVSALTAIAVMTAFAYYGLIPSAVCIAVMTVLLIAAVSRGNLMSFLPVALAALVLFGAIVLIDPGESYSISRIDENLRDRLAFNSALLETDTSPFEEEDEEYEDDEDDWSEYEGYEDEEADYSTVVMIVSIVLVVAALGAAAYLMHRRISKKRAENRRGIDSKDNKEAVTAMFPYAVRWLKGYGIVQTEPSVTSMMPEIENSFSGGYAKRFRDMYIIWSEAAYSDHEVSESTRQLMDGFMKDTVKMVDDKCKFKDRLRLKLRYAL